MMDREDRHVSETKKMNKDSLIWLSAALAIACAGLLAVNLGGCNVTPGDDDDTAGDDDDDDATSGGIYDLQQSGFTDGDYVTLEGKIVTTPKAEEGFFIQEPAGGEYSGLYVFAYSDVLDQLDIAPGQVVTVSGTMTEFYDMTELTLTSTSDFEITDTTTPLTPEVLDSSALTAANAEPWESVLVETSGTVTSLDEWGNWEVDGNVKVDDLFYHVEPAVDATVNRVAGVMNYSFEEFLLEPRDADDVDVEGAAPTASTIYEIQQGDVAEDTVVSLEGVIVTTPLTEVYGSKCDKQGFWVQDPAGGEYSGVFVVFYIDSLPGFSVTPGDVVDMSGLYSEYYDLTSLVLQDAGNYSVVSSGTVPDPAVIADPCSFDEEAYEGVTIQIQNLTVSQTIDEVGYGQFEVNECLLVDSAFFEYTTCGDEDLTPDPPADQVITSITGPLTYGYDEFKIEPVDASSFEGWTP